MKNTTQTKRNNLSNKNKTQLKALKKLFTFGQLKYTARQFLSVFFICALVFVPLLSLAPKTHGQISVNCFLTPTAQAIFQGCPLGSSLENTLTEQAVSDVIEFYNLPTTQEERERA